MTYIPGYSVMSSIWLWKVFMPLDYALQSVLKMRRHINLPMAYLGTQ